MESTERPVTVKDMRNILNRLIGAGLGGARIMINYCSLSELEEIRIQSDKDGAVTVLMSILN